MKNIIVVGAIALCSTPASAFVHVHKKHKPAADSTVSIAMQHTGCYGRCPNYKIEVCKDGTLYYTGNRYTTDTGKYVKTTDRTAAQQLFQQMKQYKLDTCKNVYYNKIADMPGMSYTIKYTHSEKTIHNAQFGPSFLTRLAEQIDTVGNKNTSGWEKVK
jgi:Domain of unknown function (DUF6438)